MDEQIDSQTATHLTQGIPNDFSVLPHGERIIILDRQQTAGGDSVE